MPTVGISEVSRHVLEFQARFEVHSKENFAAASGSAHCGRDAAGGLGQAPRECQRAHAARERTGLGGPRVYQRDDRPTGLGA